MITTPLILAIEDDPEDYRLLERILSKSADFRIIQSKTLAQGIIELSENKVDLVLLDLTLPDSKSIDAISVLMESANKPVVVLTGLDNKELAFGAVQRGAQDYLVKGSFDTALLVKTMRYAIERFRLVQELNESKLIIQREQEQRRLQSSISPTNVPAKGVLQGQKSLKVSSPDVFDHFLSEYLVLLKNSIEQRAFKVDNNVPKKLRALASELGQQRATPRDVVELHTVMLTTATENANSEKSAAFNEEGRYLLIAMLGHLCSYYRSHCNELPMSPSIDTIISPKEGSGMSNR